MGQSKGGEGFGWSLLSTSKLVLSSLFFSFRNFSRTVGVLGIKGPQSWGSKVSCLLPPTSHPFSTPYRYGQFPNLWSLIDKGSGFLSLCVSGEVEFIFVLFCFCWGVGLNWSMHVDLSLKSRPRTLPPTPTFPFVFSVRTSSASE